MAKGYLSLVFLALVLSGCATGRDLTSEHYLPEWENQLVTFPNPSESSGGQWAVRSSRAAAKGVETTVRVPLALAGNTALHAYYIPTWPLRALFKGDKRLIVWHPILKVGENPGSDFYSSEWNELI